MKKLFCSFFILLAFTALNFAQNVNTALQTKIDSILANDFFKKASISVDIYDLTEQKSLYRHNNKLLLHPASNMKVITTAAALYFLGPDYEFETKFYYKGSITDSVLNGDLFVVGGLDPDFSLSDLTEAVKKIKALGINRITGNIYGDVSAMDDWYWGEGWMWDDDPSTDFPYMTPLNINSNSVLVKVSPASDGNTTISLTPQSSYFKVTNKSKTAEKKGNSISVTRDWVNRNNNITVNGTISSESNGISKEINVYQSQYYFLTLLQEELEKQNIFFNGKTAVMDLVKDALPVFTLKRKFGEVIVNLNKTSDNLSAEMTLRALALKSYGKPASAFNGVKMVDSLLTICGLNAGNYRIVDGSGVSHYNLVTSEMLLTLLKYFYVNKPDLYKVLYNSFPIAGIDGSLGGRMKNSLAADNVHAKTGTLSGVSCLSGYVTTKSKHMVAFSVLIQNYIGGKSNASRFEDEICKLLAEIE